MINGGAVIGTRIDSVNSGTGGLSLFSNFFKKLFISSRENKYSYYSFDLDSLSFGFDVFLSSFPFDDNAIVHLKQYLKVYFK